VLPLKTAKKSSRRRSLQPPPLASNPSGTLAKGIQYAKPRYYTPLYALNEYTAYPMHFHDKFENYVKRYLRHAPKKQQKLDKPIHPWTTNPGRERMYNEHQTLAASRNRAAKNMYRLNTVQQYIQLPDTMDSQLTQIPNNKINELIWNDNIILYEVPLTRNTCYTHLSSPTNSANVSDSGNMTTRSQARKSSSKGTNVTADPMQEDETGTPKDRRPATSETNTTGGKRPAEAMANERRVRNAGQIEKQAANVPLPDDSCDSDEEAAQEAPPPQRAEHQRRRAHINPLLKFHGPCKIDIAPGKDVDMVTLNMEHLRGEMQRAKAIFERDGFKDLQYDVSINRVSIITPTATSALAVRIHIADNDYKENFTLFSTEPDFPRCTVYCNDATKARLFNEFNIFVPFAMAFSPSEATKIGLELLGASDLREYAIRNTAGDAINMGTMRPVKALGGYKAPLFAVYEKVSDAKLANLVTSWDDGCAITLAGLHCTVCNSPGHLANHEDVCAVMKRSAEIVNAFRKRQGDEKRERNMQRDLRKAKRRAEREQRQLEETRQEEENRAKIEKIIANDFPDLSLNKKKDSPQVYIPPKRSHINSDRQRGSNSTIGPQHPLNSSQGYMEPGMMAHPPMYQWHAWPQGQQHATYGTYTQEQGNIPYNNTLSQQMQTSYAQATAAFQGCMACGSPAKMYNCPCPAGKELRKSFNKGA